LGVTVIVIRDSAQCEEYLSLQQQEPVQQRGREAHVRERQPRGPSCAFKCCITISTSTFGGTCVSMCTDRDCPGKMYAYAPTTLIGFVTDPYCRRRQFPFRHHSSGAKRACSNGEGSAGEYVLQPRGLNCALEGVAGRWCSQMNTDVRSPPTSLNAFLIPITDAGSRYPLYTTMRACHSRV
jgi:hypothetical protein